LKSHRSFLQILDSQATLLEIHKFRCFFFVTIRPNVKINVQVCTSLSSFMITIVPTYAKFFLSPKAVFFGKIFDDDLETGTDSPVIIYINYLCLCQLD
jgi:hypothetical protein